MAKTNDGKFKLPGFQSTFDMTKNIGDGKYFTWAEALHFEGGSNGWYREPTSKVVVEGILKQATQLNKFREFIDKPIIVTSWYRDPVTNRRVGGVRDSYHVRGLATDFIVPGLSPYQIIHAAKEFGWKGGMGQYTSFVHLDSRNYAVFWRG